jgi:hypothetical protein
MYESTHYATIPVLLQVHQAEGGKLDCNSTEQLASSNHDEMNMRWREICQRIKFDTSLDKEKQQYFWKVLECYQDVFAWRVNWEEHFQHLDVVFFKLREVNLKLNPNKCCFAAKSITFLGHVVNKKSTKVYLSKLR